MLQNSLSKYTINLKHLQNRIVESFHLTLSIIFFSYQSMSPIDKSPVEKLLYKSQNVILLFTVNSECYSSEH
jgi:hypothetical protein